MEHATAYSVSTWLHQLHHRIGGEELLAFHLYRYKFFVDTSPRRRHCKYAAACIKLYYMDGERQELEKFLRGLQPPPPRLEAVLEMLNES